MIHRSTLPIASPTYVATRSPVNHAAGQRYRHISSSPGEVAQLESSLWAPHAKMFRRLQKRCCVDASTVITARLYLSGWE